MKTLQELKAMKNYYFVLTRIYETLIEINAEREGRAIPYSTPEQTSEKFKQLGDFLVGNYYEFNDNKF